MKYSVDYSFTENGWGNVEIDADDRDEAEFAAMNYVKDSNPDALEVEVTSIKEI